jgi:hypothetical protein
MLKSFVPFPQITAPLEAIACARSCRSSRLTRWWTQNRIIGIMEGQGGGEAQGVADPPKNIPPLMFHITLEDELKTSEPELEPKTVS